MKERTIWWFTGWFSLWAWSLLYQDFPQKLSRIPVPPTDTISTGENMSHSNGPFTHTEDLTNFLQDFEDADLQRYTCFSSEFRDQRMEAGSIAEAGFWNTVVNLCIDERMRRDQDIRRLEYMYRTGVDPDLYS